MNEEEKLAEEYAKKECCETCHNINHFCKEKCECWKFARSGFLAGLKTGKPQWHKVFTEGEPYSFEYWDIPQDNLPKVENFYFVKLKNGYVKICKLKYDQWSKQKKFYDLHGGTQSDVAEWLDYPNVADKD